MKRTMLFLAVAAAILLAAGAYAQTTGSMAGMITDENRAPLPGVAVEATSPSLQGSKMAVADNSGTFHLVFLPPGVYTVKFTLQGFAAVEQTGIRVELGRMVTLNVQMRSAFKEEVVVSGAAPVIDVRSTEVGANITAQQLNSLPVLRNFASIVQTVPGTGTDASGANAVTVYGSTGAENAYYIDGVNTTEIERGRQGKELNPDFIQEVQVKTGSYQAEYGRATGGMINAITKSGGNEFHGDVLGYYDTNSLQSNIKQEVATYRDVYGGSWFTKGFTRKDYGLDLGGYVFKDKLWFFGGYDRVDNTEDREVAKDFTATGGAAQGSIYTNTRKRDLFSGKLTWRMTPNHSLIVSVLGDPTVDTGPNNRGLTGPPTTFLTDQTSGGTDGLAKYEGVFGTNWVVSAQYAKHNERFVESGPGLPISQVRDQQGVLFAQTNTTVNTGGLGFVSRNWFERKDARVDASYFLSNFGGDHEFKFGGEYEEILPQNSTYHSGGDLIWYRCLTGHLTATGCEPGFTYYQHEVYLRDRPPGGATDPNMADYLREPFISLGKSENTAYYLQDAWHLASNVTLNLGIRWEEQKMFDRTGAVAADVKNEWQPRVGFIWDPSNRGASKVYGSWGWFYETIPTDIIHRAFGGEISTLLANQSTTTIACDPTTNAAVRAATGRPGCRIVGGGFEPVDPNLKGQYISEYILGYEQEVSKDWVVGGKLIYRSLDRVIEDSLGGDQNYYIGNPGFGLLRQSYDQTYTYLFAAPKPKRTFKGIEITAEKRFTNNWQVFASYLYSKLEGNYDGTFQASTGQLDPGINSAFDYAEFQVNNSGYLTNDRTHQFRVSGMYTFPFQLTAGVSAYWRSGVPITAFGYNDLYRNYELYLSDRGAFGRTKSEYEMDLHFGYPLKIGSGVQIQFMLDIFNALNRQGETNRNMDFTNNEVLGVFDYNTGAVLPAIKPGAKCTDLVSPANAGGCNPAFNTTNDWQDPRQIRFGVRLSF